MDFIITHSQTIEIILLTIILIPTWIVIIKKHFDTKKGIEWEKEFQNKILKIIVTMDITGAMIMLALLVLIIINSFISV